MVLQKKKFIVADPVLTTREVFHAANLGRVFKHGLSHLSRRHIIGLWQRTREREREKELSLSAEIAP